MVKEVDEVKTLMIVVVKKLQEYGFFEDLHIDCPVCEWGPMIVINSKVVCNS